MNQKNPPKTESIKTTEGHLASILTLQERLISLGCRIVRLLHAPRAGGGYALEVELFDGRRFIVLVPARRWLRSRAEQQTGEEEFYLEEALWVLLTPPRNPAFPLARQRRLVEQYLDRAAGEGFMQGSELEFFLYGPTTAEAEGRGEVFLQPQAHEVVAAAVDAVQQELAFELLRNQREDALPPSTFHEQVRRLKEVMQRHATEALQHGLFAVFRSTPPTSAQRQPLLQRPWEKGEERVHKTPEAQARHRAFIHYAEVIRQRMREVFIEYLEALLQLPEWRPLREALVSLEVEAPHKSYPTALAYIVDRGLDVWQVNAMHHSIALPQDEGQLYVPEVFAHAATNLALRFGYLMEALQASGGFMFDSPLTYAPEAGGAPMPTLDARAVWRFTLPTSAPQGIIPPHESVLAHMYAHTFVRGTTHTPDRAVGSVRAEFRSPYVGDIAVELPPTHATVRLRITVPSSVTVRYLAALKHRQPVDPATLTALHVARIEYTGHPSTPDVVARERAIAIQNVLHLVATLGSIACMRRAEGVQDPQRQYEVATDLFSWLAEALTAQGSLVPPEEVQGWYKWRTADLLLRHARAALGFIEERDIRLLKAIVRLAETQLKERCGEIAPAWKEIFERAREGVHALRILATPSWRGSTLSQEVERLRERWRTAHSTKEGREGEHQDRTAGPYLYDRAARLVGGKGLHVFGLVSLLEDEELREVLEKRFGVQEVTLRDAATGKPTSVPLSAVRDRAVLEIIAAHVYAATLARPPHGAGNPPQGHNSSQEQ